jgi:hypothetical protein
MYLQHGKYFCVLCGDEIDLSEDDRPSVRIKAGSRQPMMRSISLAAKELHACPFLPRATN